MSAAWAQKLTNLSRKYGVAWVIVNQCLGWISYICLWIALERTEYDVLGWLSKYRILRVLTGNLSKSAGNLAIAFALNRLGTPVRIFMTTWLMPYTAPSINATVNPWLRKFGMAMDLGPGVAEPTSNEPHLMDVDDTFPGLEGDQFDPALQKKLVKNSGESKKSK